MNKDINQSIDEQVAKLPENLKAFAVSQDWQKILNDIVTKHHLTVEQIDGTKLEVLFVLLGLVHPDAFLSLIIENAAIEESIAETLTQEVEQKIFTPIRPALIQFFEEERVKAEARGEFPAEGATPGIAPANIPTEVKEEPLIPPLIPKVMQSKPAAPEVILMHPFEEKLQGAPAAATAPTPSAMPATFTPAPTPIAPAPSVPVVPAAPQGAIAFTPAQNGSPRGTLTHDPYREPLE